MPVLARCDHCGKTYAVVQAALGRKARCKGCGEVFVVQAAAAPAWNELGTDAGAAYEVNDEPAEAVPAAPSLEQAVSFQPAPRLSPQDELIRKGASISALRRFFPDYDSAVAYYAKRQQAAHGARSAGGRCACCGKAGEVPIFELSWRATFNRGTTINPLSLLTIFAGAVVLRRSWETMEFRTYHGICGKCRLVYWITQLVRLPLFLVACAALVWGLAQLVWVGIQVGERYSHALSTSRHERDIWLAVIWTVVPIAWLVFQSRLRAPWALRHIGRRPFAKHRMRRVG